MGNRSVLERIGRVFLGGGGGSGYLGADKIGRFGGDSAR